MIPVSKMYLFSYSSGFLQVRENWKMSGNLCCQGNVRVQENIIFEKSGKMFWDHADCR